MMEKRMRKMETALKVLPEPKLVGQENAELTFISWGSTYSVVQDVIRILDKEGIRANHLQIKYLWPFQSQAIARLLKSCKRTLIVESNFTGQLERLIRQETGLSIQHHLRKYDGEPFGPSLVYKKAKEILAEKKVAELVGA